MKSFERSFDVLDAALGWNVGFNVATEDDESGVIAAARRRRH